LVIDSSIYSVHRPFSIIGNKKTWTHYFVYVLSGIAKHHCNHIRVKAHAIGVSIGLLLLVALSILAILIEQEYKANAFIFVSSICFVT